MKKMVITLICLTGLLSAEAQYKKASFLNKNGRTHELGFSARFMSQSIGTTPGLYYAYGRDKGKRSFYWVDLEVTFPRKFAYISTDQSNNTPVEVSGKSKLGLFYRYNYAYYLVNPENEAIKVKPFLTAGLNIAVLGSTINANSYSTIPSGADPKKIPSLSAISGGVNIGLGGLYNLNSRTALKCTAGYNVQDQINGSDFDDNLYEEYKILTSHPYVNLGIRFLMDEK